MQNKIPFISAIPNIIYQSITITSGIGQCDACSPIVSTEDIISQTKKNYKFQYISPSSVRQPLASSNYTAILSSGSQNLALLNQSATTCLRHFSNPCSLRDIPPSWKQAWGESTVESALKEMVSLGLLVPEDYTKPQFRESETVLASWLHITDRCNLSCSYCYLPHDKADMSLQTGRKAITSVFRSAVSNGYKQVKLKYSGGEPLLRFPLITELHRYAHTLAEKHHTELEGVILSNGTLLTPQIIEQIKSLNLRLMISLDGLNAYHDCHRHFPDSSGSFEKVSHAINQRFPKA